MTQPLPQPADQVFLTDSGLETDLVFSGGWDLPDFAAYPLLDTDDGRAALRQYVVEHVQVARQTGSASSWRRRPGGRAATGAPGSGTTPGSSPR